jgi:hypothetical protein
LACINTVTSGKSKVGVGVIVGVEVIVGVRVIVDVDVWVADEVRVAVGTGDGEVGGVGVLVPVGFIVGDAVGLGDVNKLKLPLQATIMNSNGNNIQIEDIFLKSNLICT